MAVGVGRGVGGCVVFSSGVFVGGPSLAAGALGVGVHILVGVGSVDRLIQFALEFAADRFGLTTIAGIFSGRRPRQATAGLDGGGD